MQRRAAAGYTALFVAIAAVGAYGRFSGQYADYSHTFWAIFLLSAITAVLLLAMAYMPVRRD